jgi:hypothetical protein
MKYTFVQDDLKRSRRADSRKVILHEHMPLFILTGSTFVALYMAY